MGSTTPGLDRNSRVALGQIPGVTSTFVIGEIFGLPAFTQFVVWDGPADYTFTDPALARVNRISSDSASDVGVQVLVVGLDENWELQSQIVILNGQTKVNLNPELIRVNYAEVLNVDLIGDVYIYEDGPITGGEPDDLTTVKGFIDAANNTTKQAVFSIPVGTKANFKGGSFWTIPGSVCCFRIKAYVQKFGGALIKAFENPIVSDGTTATPFKPEVPVIYPEKSDVYISVQTTTPGNGLTVFNDWELIQV
jgi:hypothetical protein